MKGGLLDRHAGDKELQRVAQHTVDVEAPFFTELEVDWPLGLFLPGLKLPVQTTHWLANPAFDLLEHIGSNFSSFFVACFSPFKPRPRTFLNRVQDTVVGMSSKVNGVLSPLLVAPKERQNLNSSPENFLENSSNQFSIHEQFICYFHNVCR